MSTISGLIENVEADTPSSAAIACSISARCASVCAAWERAALSWVCACETSSPGAMPASWRCSVSAERARIGLDRLIEDRAVAVEAAQLNVIVDQLRDQRQASILEIRGGRGGIGLARGDLVANLTPQVELVADAAACSELSL